MLLNKKISISYFLNQIKYQILGVTVFAVAFGFIDQLPVIRNINIPISIPALLGTAISLLLAFRTSQSYERWWEARIIWGAIVNDSRTITRLSLQFFNKEQAEKLAYRQIIWVYALSESLRKLPFSSIVENYIKEHGVRATNIPNALLDGHSDQIKNTLKNNEISDFAQLQLNEVTARLCDSMGKCERIKNTIFPRSYSVLLHTLIYIFAAILPFGLDDEQLSVEILITILIPSIFIAIEKTAIIMQDPFENLPADTPMTKICQTIETNISDMAGINKISNFKQSDTYAQR